MIHIFIDSTDHGTHIIHTSRRQSTLSIIIGLGGNEAKHNKNMSPLLFVVYFLASGRERNGGSSSSRLKSRVPRRQRGRDDLGRHRYSRDGIKKKRIDNTELTRQEQVFPLPELTLPSGPRPSYFTCRHGYERTLIDEIQRHVEKSLSENRHGISATTPYPGLVQVEDKNGMLPISFDPVYALQCMPKCVVVSAESIKSVAREVLSALLGDENGNIVDEVAHHSRQQLLSAERGSLAIHPLVPGMCKGQSSPVMLNRATMICEELSKMLKKSFAAARKAPLDENGETIQPKDRWMLQLMIQAPDVAVASLTKCQFIGPGESAYWPNYLYPLGLVRVDIEERMPSSAYRKLMEGIECMGIRPREMSTVVDLGACPGGWTSVMRKYFNCPVIAVDRSELDPVLMKDPMVTFVKGDAFTYEPPDTLKGEDLWMISDVIAYPERATELLSQWCEDMRASNMIVTMKFQGDEPDFDELDKAVRIVKDLGYYCRVKHFFNNKNEVTFMVSVEHDLFETTNLGIGDLGVSMYQSL